MPSGTFLSQCCRPRQSSETLGGAGYCTYTVTLTQSHLSPLDSVSFYRVGTYCFRSVAVFGIFLPLPLLPFFVKLDFQRIEQTHESIRNPNEQLSFA